jgi:hypothetical protein
LQLPHSHSHTIISSGPYLHLATVLVEHACRGTTVPDLLIEFFFLFLFFLVALPASDRRACVCACACASAHPIVGSSGNTADNCNLVCIPDGRVETNQCSIAFVGVLEGCRAAAAAAIGGDGPTWSRGAVSQTIRNYGTVPGTEPPIAFVTMSMSVLTLMWSEDEYFGLCRVMLGLGSLAPSLAGRAGVEALNIQLTQHRTYGTRMRDGRQAGRLTVSRSSSE